MPIELSFKASCRGEVDWVGVWFWARRQWRKVDRVVKPGTYLLDFLFGKSYLEAV